MKMISIISNILWYESILQSLWYFLFVILESGLINGRHNQFEPAQFFWYIPPFLSFSCLYSKSLIRLQKKKAPSTSISETARFTHNFVIYSGKILWDLLFSLGIFLAQDYSDVQILKSFQIQMYPYVLQNKEPGSESWPRGGWETSIHSSSRTSKPVPEGCTFMI